MINIHNKYILCLNLQVEQPAKWSSLQKDFMDARTLNRFSKTLNLFMKKNLPRKTRHKPTVS